MKQLSKLLAVTLLFSLFAAGTANAGLVLIDGEEPGNDNATNISSLVMETVTLLGKIDSDNPADNENGIFADAAALLAGFQVTNNGTSGSVTFDLTGTGFDLRYVVLKAGPSFAVFEWDMVNRTTGSFDWDVALTDILVGNGNVPALSHITFYGVQASVSEVPLPGAVWLMGAGLAGFGFTQRRRNRA